MGIIVTLQTKDVKAYLTLLGIEISEEHVKQVTAVIISRLEQMSNTYTDRFLNEFVEEMRKKNATKG